MKKKLLTGEGIFTALLLLIGIVWAVNGLRTGVWDRVTLDGGFMLLFVGAFICLLSLIVFVRLFRKEEAEPVEEDAEPGNPNKKLLFTLLFTVVGLLAMQYVLGTVVSLTAFLILWMKVYRKITWTKTLIITACVMAVIYSVFVIWLKVRFPTFLDMGIL